MEPGQHLDEIGLRGHDLVDVLVDHRYLIDPGGEEPDLPALQDLARGVPAEGVLGLRAAHDPTRAVRRGVERGAAPSSANHVRARCHRAGNDAQVAVPGGGRSLPVHDQLLTVVGLLPREVVVVLDVEHHLRGERLRDVPVDELVVRRRVAPHEVHRLPVLLPGLGVEVEPSEVAQLRRQLRVRAHRQLGVVLRDGRTRAAAPRMREQREVDPRLDAGARVENLHRAELDEVVSAPGRAELLPRAVLHVTGDSGDAPVLVHDVVLSLSTEAGPDPEARLPLDRAGELVGAARFVELRDGEVEHRHLHPAGDVDPDRVRDHRVPRGQHSADREAVALVGVGHQRPAHRDRQLAGVFHLFDGARLEVASPLLVGGELFSRYVSRLGGEHRLQFRSERAELRVARVAIRRLDDVADLLDGVGLRESALHERGAGFERRLHHRSAGDSHRGEFSGLHRASRMIRESFRPSVSIDESMSRNISITSRFVVV